MLIKSSLFKHRQEILIRSRLCTSNFKLNIIMHNTRRFLNYMCCSNSNMFVKFKSSMQYLQYLEFVKIQSFDVESTISRIRNLQIFLTSSTPVIASVSFELFSRLSNPDKMASFLFSRAHITNGKPNFCLYCWFRLFIFCFSCSVRFWRPALLCSLVDSAVKLPDAARRPARSGWSRKIPSFPGIVKKQNYICYSRFDK